MNRASWYRTQPARIALRMLAFAVLFAIIGVLIGGPLAFFAMYAPMLWKDPQNASKLISALPYAWLGGCLFGLIPAAATGAVAGWWRPRLHHWRFRWALTAIGMASTLLWLGLFFEGPRDRAMAREFMPISVVTAALMTLAITTFIGRRNTRASEITPH